ncbi:anti-anti-sigma factor [Asanoa ferruginea]|uniref:Anti-anti-sigma factor n=1 Tax=Asanoa ferruginea TaxID=53367 RepID=A0A3D9ZU27_9ACTN|nr:anti-anti-sigma factor [Asanoa ferruginea]
MAYAAGGNGRISISGDLGASSHLSIAVHRGPSTARVVAIGEVDTNSAEQLGAAVSGVLGGPPTALTIDVAGVTFLDTAGIFVLVRAHIFATDQGSTATVVNCQPPVRRVLEIAGIFLLLTDQ